MSDFPSLPIPPMARARQILPRESLTDLSGEIRRALASAGLAEVIRPGMRVALTAGSRGIAEIPLILATVVRAVREVGAEPFIVPAMGSHGGARAEGQVEVLESYGITEAAVGCPIRATMDTVVLGQLPTGATLHMDRNAADADATIVVARTKAHTGFRGDVESGLCKMIAIGLGKQRGAESIHAHGLAQGIKPAAELAARKSNIVLGLAVVENAFHQIHTVRATRVDGFIETDRELLKLSNRLMPRVPFEELDVLVVNELGKNISGSGMDPNVIGMWRRTGEPPFTPSYKQVVVLDITPESHGNAIGIGLADVTTERLFQKMDRRKSYMNSLTANTIIPVRIPPIMDSDREAVEVALKLAGADEAPRVVWIRNTLALEEMFISEALIAEARASGALEVLTDPAPLPFDASGNLQLLVTA